MRVDPDLWAKGPNPGKAKEPTVQRVSKLTLTDKNAMPAPEKVDIGVSVGKTPPRCPLLAKITFIYMQRKVADARSYIEGEQKPQYVQQSVTNKEPVTLVPAHEVRKPSWRVRLENNPDNVLHLSDIFNQRLPLDPVSHKLGKGGYWLSWAGLDDGTAFPVGKFVCRARR